MNVTLLFSPAQYSAAAAAYVRGIERRIEAGLVPIVGSVASLFVSRWDRAVVGKVPVTMTNMLGLAIAAKTYRAHRELLASDRWQRLANKGARPQRLLWASMSTKAPASSDVLHVEGLAAPHTIDTMPDATLLAFADHGQCRGSLRRADRQVSHSVRGDTASVASGWVSSYRTTRASGTLTARRLQQRAGAERAMAAVR